MKCKRILDYGEKSRCPEYDLINCENPSYPIGCPLLSNRFKNPCYRWLCRSLDLDETTTIQSFFTKVILHVNTSAKCHQSWSLPIDNLRG